MYHEKTNISNVKYPKMEGKKHREEHKKNTIDWESKIETYGSEAAFNNYRLRLRSSVLGPSWFFFLKDVKRSRKKFNYSEFSDGRAILL